MPEWLLQVGAYIAFAGAVYGGIRADLKNAKECAQAAKASATRAHDRIDNLLVKG